MPFPDLAIILAGQHFPSRARIDIAREKIRSGKSAFGQSDDGVQADRLGRNRASDPGQRGRFRSRIEVENFDRFSAAVMNGVQSMDGIAAGSKRETVRAEHRFLGSIRRAGAGVVGLPIELFFRCR